MKKVIPLLLSVLLLHFNSSAQKSEDIYSLSHPDSLQVKDFKQLRPFLKNKRIIVAGEANHGTREFYQVKKALLQYLVEKEKLRHFAIEANYAACQVVNDYVSGKTDGDANQVVKNFYVWPFQTKEFVDIITWMRSYNSSKAEKDQLKFWGFDMQQAYPAVKTLNNAVAQKTGKAAIELPVFDDKMKEIMYQPEDADIKALTSAVKTILPNHPEKEELEMNLRLLERHNIYYQKYLEKDNSGRNIVRDSCMAEMAKEIINGFGKNEKIMLWAHNSHIFKSNNNKIRRVSMGSFLKPVYKDDIYFIGFDFNEGTFTLAARYKPVTVTPVDYHTLARRFDKQAYNLMFIPFTDKNTDIHTQLVGMRYNDLVPKQIYAGMYDAIFFVNQVNSTTMVE